MGAAQDVFLIERRHYPFEEHHRVGLQPQNMRGSSPKGNLSRKVGSWDGA